jgi:hypothetical protein
MQRDGRLSPNNGKAYGREHSQDNRVVARAEYGTRSLLFISCQNSPQVYFCFTSARPCVNNCTYSLRPVAGLVYIPSDVGRSDGIGISRVTINKYTGRSFSNVELCFTNNNLAI